MSQFAPTQPDTLEKQCRYFSIHRNIVGGLNAKAPKIRDKAVSNSESQVNSGNQLTDGESDKAK